MSTEIEFNLKIISYRDHDGNPTCAIDFKDGKVCKFFMTSNFGQDETCFFAEDYHKLYRTNNGKGFLIPHENCPIWKGE